MPTKTKTCIERVSTNRGWHSHICGRKAIDGDYCGIHSPTRRKERWESKCYHSTDGRMCGKPAVTVEYGFGLCEQHSPETLARQWRLEGAAPAMLEALKGLTTPRHAGPYCPWCGDGGWKTPYEAHGLSCPLLPAVDLIAQVEGRE